MKLWKGLAIYPKVLQEKPLSEFTKKEKEYLTRKGLRWRVYFSYFNPSVGENGAFEKHTVPTGGMNKEFPNFDDRFKAIHRLFQATEEMLEDGRNPLEVTIEDNEVVTIEKGIDFALANKKLSVSKGTYDNYVIRANQLKEFLRKKGQLKRDTHSFSHKVIRDFLRDLAKNSSMANRNNALRVIKALFSEMYKNDLIPHNHVAKIDPEKVKTQRFLSYSFDQAKTILEKLEKEDPVLALFVKFIGYNFLRPVEVVRLKVEDLDLENKLLQVWVKQGKYKTKRIPDDIVESLKSFDLSKKGNLLFVRDQISGKWKRDEEGRRQYYSKRYSSFIRELGYGEGYVLYSNRHTYITIAYRNLRKRMSKDDTIDTLMGYTGHDTREALQKYIHYHDAEIVDEYGGIVE